MKLNTDRKTATTITRLMMKHHKYMKISIDGTKIYQKCGNHIDVELTPHYVFNCPAVAAAMHCLDHPSNEAFNSDTAISIAKIVITHHNI